MKKDKKVYISEELIFKGKQILTDYQYNKIMLRQCQNKIINYSFDSISVSISTNNEKILEAINTLQSPYKDILYLRYIKMFPWPKVANDVNYSYEYVRGKLFKKSILLFIEAYSKDLSE